MKTVCFTGHRPKELFGTYAASNPRASLLAEKLINEIERLIVEEDVTTFWSAGAQGMDQIAFICVQVLKKKYPHIENKVAVPYKDQPVGWENTLKKAKDSGWAKVVSDLELNLKRYYDILQLADEVVYVDTIKRYQPKGMLEEDMGKHANQKLHLASIFMLDQADIVVATYNGGGKGGTYRCVQEAKKQSMRIINLDPNQDFQIQTSE